MSVRYKSERQSEHWREKAFQVQKVFWGDCCDLTYTTNRTNIKTLEAKLQHVRDSLWQEVGSIMPTIASFRPGETISNDEIRTYFQHVKSISARCSESMLAFTKNVVHTCVSVLTDEPPCAFSVMVIGSIARSEATPYSDLEFMFIVEDKDPESICYFEMLAVTIYFFIGNLRETPLKYLNIAGLEWFEDRQKSGFKIDGLGQGAGNIPTGNGMHNKNKFILTPDDLFKRYCEILDNPPEESLCGDLTAMLTYTQEVYCYGPKSMLGEFLFKKDGKTVNSDRAQANVKMLTHDIKKFNFKPTDDLRDKGFTIDVKHDMYRFPSMIIFDLAIVTGLAGLSSWDTLDLLFNNHHISAPVYWSFSFMLATGCFVRLCTYLHHDSQNQVISLLNADHYINPVVSSSLVSRPWFVPQNLFFKQCEFMLPLKAFMKEFDGNLGYFQITKICDDILLTLMMALAYHYCSEHSKAFDTIKTLVQEPEHLNGQVSTDHLIDHLLTQLVTDSILLLDIIYIVARCLYLNRRYEESLRCYLSLEAKTKDIQATQTQTEGWEQEKLTAMLCYAHSGAGTCYHRLQNPAAEKQYHSAIKQNRCVRYEQVEKTCISPKKKSVKRLRKKKKTYAADMQALIFAELNLACFYQKRAVPEGRSKNADFALCERHNLRALQLSADAAAQHVILDYYGNVIRSSAKSEHTPHNVLNLKKRLSLKDPSQKKALSFRNLGNLYQAQSQHLLAEMHYRKSVEMYAGAFGKDAVHRDVADVFFNRGNNFKAMARYNDALKSYKLALRIFQRVHSNEPNHPNILDVRSSLNSVLYPCQSIA